MRSPRYQAAELLRNGMSPSQIAREMHIPLGAVMAYLYRMVGEGELRRSDILFTLPRGTRQQIEKMIQERGITNPSRIRRALGGMGADLDPSDLQLYLKLRDARVHLGDMYELVRDLELSLHKFIRDALMQRHKDNWWREGIPLRVREDCALMNERDADPATDLFCYSTVIHLLHTFDYNWPDFAPLLPPKLRANKQEFLGRLKRLNAIRNMVMHPVKGADITEEDFDFLREFHADFARALASSPQPQAASVADKPAAAPAQQEAA
jgi:hypothetical protein